MNYTSHYNLHKPELSERFDLADWNTNSDLTDAQMFQNANDISTIMSALTTKDVSSADTLYSKMMKLVYPVGSLYWSSNSTNPAQLFGGTWTQIKDKFIWAKGDSDTINATGGEKTHTLTESEMPSHSHSFTPAGKIASTSGGTDNKTSTPNDANVTITDPGHKHSYNYRESGSGSSSMGGTRDTSFPSRSTASATTGITATHSHTHNAYFTGTAGTTGTKGSGTAHNNMPPYIVKYCWERTA